MLYRPVEGRRLWDTWLFPWQGEVHLFHLETHETLWDHIGHAVSSDWVHWETRPSIPTAGASGQWNEQPTLTGMVVRHEDRFWMFAGSIFEDRQVVGLMTSDDLDRWEPHPASPVMVPTGPHYMTEPGPPAFPTVDWRDPCVRWDEAGQCFEALLCARLPRWDHADTGACVARVRSRDLVHWDALPPLAVGGKRFFNMEVPDLFCLGGRYYLLFSTISVGGLRIDTPNREAVKGTFYMTAEAPDGPYRLPEDPLLLGAGNGRMDAYVGRTIPHEGGRLLYHQVAGPRTAFAMPKYIRQQEDGTLLLAYFEAMDGLETATILAETDEFDIANPAMGMGRWEERDGQRVGTSEAVGTAVRLPASASDFHLQATLTARTPCRAGIAFHCQDRAGGAVALDFGRGEVQVGPAEPGLGLGIARAIADRCRRDLQCGREYRVRLFVRAEFVECYLDDGWVFTTVLGDMPDRGAIYLWVEGGTAAFEGLRVAAVRGFDTA